MTIEQALERIDSLCPNSFTQQEKVGWINDCESILRLEAVKQYAYAETSVRGGCTSLPRGVRSEDVVKVYIGGVPAAKYDVRSGKIQLDEKDGERVGVVFLQRHVPQMPLVYSGEIQLEPGAMTLNGNPFYCGQDVIIDCPLLEGEYPVLGSSGDKLFLDIQAQGATEGTVTLRLNQPLCAPAPYDSIYVYYVCAQMDYYNKDYESYNHNSILYQDALDGLQRLERRTAPLDATAVVRNLW